MKLPDLVVSFSGGKTSGYMLRQLTDHYDGDMKVCFMNTGCEDERTLEFVNRCAVEWEIDIIWLEAVIHHTHQVGTTHKIVTFETASRNGEPFEEMIKKYGIPNKKFPHCTRELKLRAITDYLRYIGWNNAVTAIGIRADEPDRLNPKAKEVRIVYPLAHWWPTDKSDINDWWLEQSFQLGLLEHEGNCTWCWKKSLKKLVRIAKEAPERFSFPLRMEAEHGIDRLGNPLSFFRENRTAKDIIQISDLMTSQAVAFPEHADEDFGCSESCEVFG